MLVTGATGMIGRATCERLLSAGWVVRAAVRSPGAIPGVEAIPIEAIDESTDWSRALEEINTVVHIAGYAHAVDRTSAELCKRVNEDGTRRLADAAARTGISRFVYLSTSKVHGEGQPQPYTEENAPAPADAYAISKWRGETAVWERRTAFVDGCSIVRPPMVYGAGVRANFLSLMRIVDRGLPLPVGSVQNARSVVFAGNLADALTRCADDAAAANQRFLVSDGPAVTTADLVRAIAHALGRRPRILSIPPGVLRFTLRALGKGAAADRLLGSFVVSDVHLRSTLEWTPPYTMAHGLSVTADWFRQRR